MITLGLVIAFILLATTLALALAITAGVRLLVGELDDRPEGPASPY